MNTQTQQFKPGDKALLEVEISERLPVSSEDYYYNAIVRSDLSWHSYHVPIKGSRLLPLPREGGYRLTLEELILLLTDYGNTRHHGSKITPSEFAPLWLANRKEEA